MKQLFVLIFVLIFVMIISMGCMDWPTGPDRHDLPGPPCPWLTKAGYENFEDHRCDNVDWNEMQSSIGEDYD